MAVRRRDFKVDDQLDLFSNPRPTYESIDPIRPAGGETLARTPSENGARVGGEGAVESDAARSGGRDEGRNGHAANGVDAAGINGAAGAHAGVGNGAGEIHLPASRVVADSDQADRQKPKRRHRQHQEEPPKNLNAYRITEADRLSDGGAKQKFQRNLAAIQILRTLDAEERPATEKEKAALVKYVGWGGLPQVFDVDNADWHKEQIQLSEILSDDEQWQ